MMEEARLRLHALMLSKLLLWKLNNYSKENYHKVKRVRELGLNLEKNLYWINDKNVLIVIFNTLCNWIANSALT